MRTSTPASGIPPLHQHGAFFDLDAALDRIRLAADALDGIGILLMPEHTRADDQLNMALRSQAAAIFVFFGEVLSESRENAAEALHYLQRDIEHATKGDQS